MTDIEVLLSVDAGRTPDGSVAFFMVDPKRSWRRLSALLSGLSLSIAMLMAAAGREPVWIVALSLVSGIFALLAVPALEERVPLGHKRPVVVITGTTIMVRSSSGLRSWTFENLARAEVAGYADRMDLTLVGRDGTRAFIDGRAFDRGDRLLDAISIRVPTAFV